MIKHNNPASAGSENTANRIPADIADYIPRHIANKDRAYSDAKIAWLRDHPAATSQQVEAAFREIAEELGL